MRSIAAIRSTATITWTNYVSPISPKKAIEGLEWIDLIDADLQAAEIELLDCMDLLTSKVRMVHIGTHGIEIEARLRERFQQWGWICQWDFSLKGERETPFGPIAFDDGVQTWINPEFLRGVNSEAATYPVRSFTPDRHVAGFPNQMDRIQDEFAAFQAKTAATADRLEALEAEHDAMRRTLNVLTEGAETWLLPTLAKHSAAIARRPRPLRGLGQLGARLKSSLTARSHRGRDDVSLVDEEQTRSTLSSGIDSPNKFERRITEEEIATYHDKGVVICRGLLPANAVAEWLDAWLRLKNEIASGIAQVHRSDRFVSGTLPDPLGSVYRHPSLIDAATKLIAPDVALYFNRLLVKDNEWNGHVHPHQDCVYFHGSTDKMSAFVPFTEFSLRTGAVTFIEGSHKFGNLGRQGHIIYDDWEPMPSVTPEAYPGDVIFATFEIWHHSTPATIPCERPLMQIAYQSAADGSYYGEPAEPVLVAGQWRTNNFSRYLHGIHPAT